VSRQLRLVGQLLGSTVLAQVAVLGAIAAAARATTARDFADYGVVTSVTAVVATFNTWAAESRTTVVEEDRAHEISRAGLAVLWMVLALITLAAALAAVMGQHRLGLLLGLGGVGAAVTGGLQLVQGVVLRRQQQHLLAHSRATQGLSNAALILLFLAIGLPGFVIITIPWLISLVLGLVVLLRATGDRSLWWGRSSWAEWRVLRSETRWQPGSNVLVSLAGALPMLVLPAVGAVEVAGAWALVARFLMPVVSTLNSTFGPIYLGHAAGMIRRRELPQLRRYHARWTLLLAAGWCCSWEGPRMPCSSWSRCWVPSGRPLGRSSWPRCCTSARCSGVSRSRRRWCSSAGSTPRRGGAWLGRSCVPSRCCGQRASREGL